MTDTLQSPVAVLLNGTTHRLPSPTIAHALDALGIPAEASHVAIAHNDAVVPRTRWHSVVLQEHDRLEIITAVAGG
jgi:sulfur carrier protein